MFFNLASPLSYPRPQALFVTKIQEYATKKAAAGGSMVDAICGLNPATEAELDKVRLALILSLILVIIIIHVLIIIIMTRRWRSSTAAARAWT